MGESLVGVVHSALQLPPDIADSTIVFTSDALIFSLRECLGLKHCSPILVVSVRIASGALLLKAAPQVVRGFGCQPRRSLPCFLHRLRTCEGSLQLARV